MISMFAIPNCDTVKKARKFLEHHQVVYEFIDFKKTPPTKEQIKLWGEFAGELPINKKGTTYRKYKDHYEGLSSLQQIDFIIANPSLIKRPVLVQDNRILALGFAEEHYEHLLKSLRDSAR
ncbi:arsenate reductase family protein [Legionella worsleiensis]|uniref:Arsenate reductase n=1 Tax=Legionella worsleiensis TaxID=45076 RepID=A0A0W1AJS7_9GAMM|nr:arsenate reductase family protein [Legionella worsleiensis]KTD81504.1 arsenate reductase [Legionella worsleiensis]STY32063.1 arsenate reductase [Legionella worsleiensis]